MLPQPKVPPSLKRRHPSQVIAAINIVEPDHQKASQLDLSFLRAREGDLLQLKLKSTLSNRNPLSFRIKGLGENKSTLFASNIKPGEQSEFGYYCQKAGLFSYEVSFKSLTEGRTYNSTGSLLIEPTTPLPRVDSEILATLEATHLLEPSKSYRVYVLNSSDNTGLEVAFPKEMAFQSYDESLKLEKQHKLYPFTLKPGELKMLEIPKSTNTYFISTKPNGQTKLTSPLPQSSTTVPLKILNLIEKKAKAPIHESVLFKREGEKIYNAKCLECHLIDGRAVEGKVPQLSLSDFLVDRPATVKALVEGIKGPLVVNRLSYQGQMPQTYLSDEAIAQVLTFVGSSWGNALAPYTTEEVTALRNQFEKSNRGISTNKKPL